MLSAVSSGSGGGAAVTVGVELGLRAWVGGWAFDALFGAPLRGCSGCLAATFCLLCSNRFVSTCRAISRSRNLRFACSLKNSVSSTVCKFTQSVPKWQHSP